MNKKVLIGVTASTFVIFGILLSIGIGLSNSDEIDEIDEIKNNLYRIDNLESKINALEREHRR